MCSLRFKNNFLTIEGVRFASISKKTPMFAFVSLALPLLLPPLSIPCIFSPLSSVFSLLSCHHILLHVSPAQKLLLLLLLPYSSLRLKVHKHETIWILFYLNQILICFWWILKKNSASFPSIFRQNFEVRTFSRWLSTQNQIFLERYPTNFFYKKFIWSY